MKKEEVEQELLRRRAYFQELCNDERFYKYVMEPMSSQRDYYLSKLRAVESTEQEIRAAQGAVHALECINDLFERAEESFATLMKRKEKGNAGSRNTGPGRRGTKNASDLIELAAAGRR